MWNVLPRLLLGLFVLFVFAGIPTSAHRQRPVLAMGSPTTLETPALRDGRLGVMVVGAEGGPVRGARVVDYVRVDDVLYTARTGVTNHAGALSFAALPRGDHLLIVEAEGYARFATTFVLSVEPNALRVELLRARTLDVEVVDEQGAPLVGAEVAVRGAESLPYGLRTAEGGRAEFRNLGPGPFAVEAKFPGYEEKVAEGVTEGSTHKLVLAKLGALRVHVLTSEGAPAAGATVEVVAEAGTEVPFVVTGTDGVAHVLGLPTGAYSVRATRGADLSPASVALSVERPHTRDVSLSLAPGRSIRVSVVTDDGTGTSTVPSAALVLTEESAPHFPLQATSDAEGSAILFPAPRGACVVTASASGFGRSRAVVVPADQAVVEMVLNRSGTLLGTVTDADGSGVVGAEVSVVGVDQDGRPFLESGSEASVGPGGQGGGVSRPAAPIATARMRAIGELGVMLGPIPPIPPRGEAPRPIPLPAAPPAAVGSAASRGRPWVTEGGGAFRIHPVTPGAVRVRIRHPDYLEALSDSIALPNGAEIRLPTMVLKKGGRIVGRVVDAHGRPVPSARVRARGRGEPFDRMQVTGPDGTFTFGSVPAHVTLSVVLAGEGEGEGEVGAVDVSGGDATEHMVTLALPEMRESVRVRVVDGRGDPLPGAKVLADSWESQAPLRALATTDKSGVAILRGARGLSLRLDVSLRPYAPRVLDVRGGNADVVVALQPAETVEGEVRAEIGLAPVEGARVALVTQAGVFRGRTEKDGRVRIEGVPAGPGDLCVAHEKFAMAHVRVTVPDTRRVRSVLLPRVDLLEQATLEGRVTDDQGAPVSGVRVFRADHSLCTQVLGAVETTSDADGQFRLGQQPEGTLALLATSRDGRSARVDGVRGLRGTTTVSIAIRLVGAPGATAPLRPRGVSVVLGESADPREVVIASVLPGSAAERAGLRAGDVLVEVDGVRVTTMEDARRRLVGPVGREVRLRIRRELRETVVAVRREN